MFVIIKRKKFFEKKNDFIIINIYDQTDLSSLISFTLTNFQLVVSFLEEMGLNKLKMLVM